MLIRRFIGSLCVAAVPVAAGLMVLSARGTTFPLPARQAPQSQASAQSAAPPAEKTAAEAFKNIQVLKDVPRSQLMPAMFYISASLGVGCDHCHVTSDSGPWPFEKDDKKPKQTARDMIKMMRAINDQNFGGRLEVTCATCHAGHPDPSNFSPIFALGASPRNEEEEEGAATQLPTVDQILAKYTEALGGEAAIAAVSSRTITGTLLGESGRSDQLAVTEKAPAHIFLNITGANGHNDRRGFDGETAWNGDADGVFETRGIERATFLRDYQLFPAAGLKARFPRRFVTGTDKIGDEDAYVLRAGGPGGISEQLFFSVNSGLLLRRIAYTQTPLGRLAEQTDFSDYRQVDGVRIPFTIQRMEFRTRWTEKYSAVKQNVSVEDSVFRKPAPPAAK